MRRRYLFNPPAAHQSTQSGFSGWWMLLLAWLAVYCSGPAQTYGVSTFVDPMIRELGMSRSLFSSLYSVATLCSAVGLMVMGRQIDRWGSRAVLTLAAVGFALGTLTLSVATGPIVVLLGFALTRSFGQGVFNLSARTLVPQWFVRQRGRALSLLGLATTFSLASIPPLHERLISWVGWRTTWQLDAVFVSLVLVPVFLLFVRNRPEDIGQHPDGQEPIADATTATVDAIDGVTLPQARRTVAFWGLVSASLVPALVMTGLSFNQVAILTDKGLPSSVAASMFTVESLCALPTTLAIGWLVSRFPVRYVLVAGQVALGLAMVALLFANGVALALVYAAMRGISGACWMVGADVAWPEYYGRRHLGSIRGFGFATTVFGAALGPLPFGIAYDTLGGYSPAIAGLLVLPVVATIAVWFAKPPVLPAPPEA